MVYITHINIFMHGFKKCYNINNLFQYNINTENITLKKVASAFKDHYQKYSIPMIDNPLDNNFLYKSLDHAKKRHIKHFN